MVCYPFFTSSSLFFTSFSGLSAAQNNMLETNGGCLDLPPSLLTAAL